MIKLRFTYLSVALLLTAVAFASPVPAPRIVEAATCDTSGSNYFDGVEHTSFTNIGAMAYISNQDAKLCGAAWSDSSAWAMTTNISQGVYLQAGIGKSATDTMMLIFSEWKPRGGTAHRVTSYHPLGSAWYKAGLDTTSSKWYLAWSGDGTTWNNLDIVADSSLNWFSFGDRPNQTQYEAEVHDSHDAVFGSSVSKGTWSSMQYKSSTTSTWTSEYGITATGPDSAIAGHAQFNFISNTNFQVWDTQN